MPVTTETELPVTPTTVEQNPAPVQTSALNIPDEIVVLLPDIASSVAGAIGFTPNASLPRVTDAQRAQDEVVYREQSNAALNLRDSIKVASDYVSAGVAATKLGRALIQYKTGIADIRTAEFNLTKAQTKTAIAQAQLQEVQTVLNYHNAALPHIQAEYQHKLTEAQNKAERARLKAESFLSETAGLLV